MKSLVTYLIALGLSVLNSPLIFAAEQAPPEVPPWHGYYGPWHMHGHGFWWIFPLMMILMFVFFFFIFSRGRGRGWWRWMSILESTVNTRTASRSRPWKFSINATRVEKLTKKSTRRKKRRLPHRKNRPNAQKLTGETA